MTDPVLKRVAIRKYTTEKVAQDDIAKLINAFQASPCGMHHIIIDAGDILQQYFCSFIE